MELLYSVCCECAILFIDSILIVVRQFLYRSCPGLFVAKKSNKNVESEKVKIIEIKYFFVKSGSSTFKIAFWSVRASVSFTMR